ncbi:polysaccharide deacetylase family protein [Paenarthrobacter sp. A20]|uniref:polysaccharide deacetylase family protein n=1 Tax=Paenarthrobacter sp. A20 TaxID=2817891 RepID=UPI00209C9D82|nr:polysaccharide deacetylase family protein [Paenarthrobacter sp. A20]MCP1411342.1 peptidoglycan/xylan/chitin deacetylase (PgdA/CDA1 family) [Paenarthrobacter sp. A20]
MRSAPVRSPFTILLMGIVLLTAACVPMTVQPSSLTPPAIAVIGTAPQRIIPGPSIVDMTTRTAGTSPTVATWQYISGAESFNSRLDARLLSILDARAGGRHQPEALPPTPSALLSDGVSITHEIIFAAGSVVGSRFVQTTMVGGERVGLVDEIIYQDLSTGDVTDSAALISPAMTGTLRAILGENGGPAHPEPPPGSAVAPGVLNAIAFTAEGNLSVTLHHDPVTGAPRHPVTMIVNAETTGEVLSPAGQALRRTIMAKTPPHFPAPAPMGLEHIDCDLVACAALTYDDGPNAQTTRLLGILEKHKVFATFFQQGGYVRANPKVAASVAAAGHTVANHTMSHPNLTKLSSAGIEGEINGARKEIEKATGVVPGYLRPPYGASNASVADAVGLPQILWDVDSMDWQSKDKAVYLPRIMRLVKPGSIILQHDVHASTVDGQDELITQLKGKGLYLVTLPQLFAGIDLKPGASYKCRGTTAGCVPGR